jgi:hypothetical protein
MLDVITRVLPIGVGSHARRFYLPSLTASAGTQPVVVAAVVELEGQGAAAKQALVAAGYPDAAINAVIVATETMARVGYALWVIDRRLPLLLDTPISARRDSVRDPPAAAGIAEDFDTLAAAYRKSHSQHGTPPIVSHFRPRHL